MKLGLYISDDDEADACYACYETWFPEEGERHRPGCPRLDHPAGLREGGTCYECGAREYPSGACSNEGGCRRWRDPGAELDFEPIPYGEHIAAKRELEELPF